MNVVVIGGGVAGIVAALDCAAAGASVTLVEVRPRLGGAAYSVTRDGDLWIDNGQHVFLRCCSAYRELLGVLGSEPLVELQPRLEIAVLAPGRPPSVIRRTGAPPPLHLARALLGYRLLSVRERLRAGRAALALGRAALDDSRTLGDWLRQHGQSPRAIAALWDLIALPTLNLRAAEASLALGAFVFQEGLLTDAAAGDVGLHLAPLQQIIGDPAAAALARAGVAVRLRWRAQRITPIGARFAVVGAGGWLGADAVIVAVPHERAAPMLPEAALQGARWPGALGSSPIVNLHVVYDRRVLEQRFVAGVDTPVQYVFDRTPPSWNGRQYVAVSLSGADAELAMSAAALRERYEPALAELLPAARGARVERFTVTKEHAATFRATPGTAALRPGPRTPLPGLALAGAWTATGWPATLEGAARSGRAAAEVVLGAAAHESSP
jgi:squalene-associated FAD-dependent desaturase